MKTLTMSIEGMSCGGCVSKVRKALTEIPGVTMEDGNVGSATGQDDRANGRGETVREAVQAGGGGMAGSRWGARGGAIAADWGGIVEEEGLGGQCVAERFSALTRYSEIETVLEAAYLCSLTFRTGVTRAGRRTLWELSFTLKCIGKDHSE